MYIPDVHDYGTNEEHTAAAEPFLSQGQQDAVKREIEGIVNSERDLELRLNRR